MCEAVSLKPYGQVCSDAKNDTLLNIYPSPNDHNLNVSVIPCAHGCMEACD